MNLQQQERFYQAMSRSRAASTSKRDDKIITEVVEGLIVSRPAKRIEHISETKTTNDAKVWNLTKDSPVPESKAGSVPSINKMREIHNFMRSNGRI